MSLVLSALDQSVSLAGSSEDAAIRDSVSLAAHCEAEGYHRFWLSEHHALPTIIGTAPEVLMAAVAATTQRIRIGSAGVMLPHYSAFKVAEQFRVLEALAPGRIDLGVGRAPGGDMRTAMALNPQAHHAAEHFPQQVRDLQAWTSGQPHNGITAHPRGPHAPQVWVLGSSDYGAQLRRTSACRMPLPISSWTARVWNRRCACTATSTARASGTPRRSPPSVCGRWPPTPKKKPATMR